MASSWYLVHSYGCSNNGIQPKRFQLQPVSCDSQGRVINTWADILNRSNLGMEVMHERNNTTSLDLAAGESLPVALVAPAVAA